MWKGKLPGQMLHQAPSFKRISGNSFLHVMGELKPEGRATPELSPDEGVKIQEKVPNPNPKKVGRRGSGKT